CCGGKMLDHVRGDDAAPLAVVEAAQGRDGILVGDLDSLVAHELDEVRLDFGGVGGYAPPPEGLHELAPACAQVDDTSFASELVHVRLLAFGHGPLGPEAGFEGEIVE